MWRQISRLAEDMLLAKFAFEPVRAHMVSASHTPKGSAQSHGAALPASSVRFSTPAEDTDSGPSEAEDVAPAIVHGFSMLSALEYGLSKVADKALGDLGWRWEWLRLQYRFVISGVAAN